MRQTLLCLSTLAQHRGVGWFQTVSPEIFPLLVNYNGRLVERRDETS